MTLTNRIEVEAEETVYSGCYSNNGSSPMWCYSNTCLVRLGNDVFVSGYERIPQYSLLNDCRWALFQHADGDWKRQQADEVGRQREPSPLGCLPEGKLLLSSNPTLSSQNAAGNGPAQPELLVFDCTQPEQAPQRQLPGWQGNPQFSEHSYRSMAVDAALSEVILFQNAAYSNSEWALRGADGKWLSGQLMWPAYAEDDLAPFGASHARVNYPVVVVHNRAVHFCGAVAYDNWDRVRTVEDLGYGLSAPGSSGMAGRQRGNRFRRLLYTWTDRIDERPFRDWIEIDNTFDDGGWLFASDMHIDSAGTVHLLWFRSPMLPGLRDALYPDIERVYRIEYATLRSGKLVHRRRLVEAGEGADPAIPTDLDQVGWPYVLRNGKRILSDPIATPRFHIAPDGRLFVVYYVTDDQAVSENRIMELRPEGAVSAPVTIPLKYPFTQFFTATPRAGCQPSWTLDLLGHRRGDWRPREGADYREWDGTISYARVHLIPDVERS